MVREGGVQVRPLIDCAEFRFLFGRSRVRCLQIPFPFPVFEDQQKKPPDSIHPPISVPYSERKNRTKFS